MPRVPDPLRKPQLVDEILDHLTDKPLSSLSFRTLATALGVSTFTLVYHFGTRAQLLADIVAAISSRSSWIESRLVENPGTIDVYIENLVLSWQWTLEPRNRQLQRLEFEAGLMEALARDEFTTSRTLFDNWLRIGTKGLMEFGLAPQDAEVETRLIVTTFFGLQYDAVVNQDDVRATAAFFRAIEQHRERLEYLIARGSRERSGGASGTVSLPS